MSYAVENAAPLRIGTGSLLYANLTTAQGFMQSPTFRIFRNQARALSPAAPPPCSLPCAGCWPLTTCRACAAWHQAC
jgi:hypothetical protein